MEEGRRWDVTTEEGFLACYDATFADVYRRAARLTGGDRQRAEDLVQDTYLSLLRAVEDGNVDEVGHGWMLTRVRHRFLDLIRSRERADRRLRLVASADTEASSHAPDAGAEFRRDAVAALAGLADRERAALVLRYVDDLPVAEVAHLLGTSVRATESLLQRAKRKARRSGGA